MKRMISTLGLVLLGGGGGIEACGPFFPDTVLDHPQASLEVPPVSYLHELSAFAGTPVPDALGGFDLLEQIPLEIAELEELWSSQGVAEEEIAKRAEDYRVLRTGLLEFFVHQSTEWPEYREKPPAPPVPQGRLDDRYPPDVADYVEAARLLAAGDKAAARELWREIVDRPAGEKRLRGAWSAWMLGRTAADKTEAVHWYRRVLEEVRGGARDAIGLEAAANGWLATLDPEADLLESIRLSFRAYQLGQQRAAIDVRRGCRRILWSKDAELMAEAAADETVRQLVNLDLCATLDRSGWQPVESAVVDPVTLWSEAVEVYGPEEDPDASKIAWALYATGRFDQASDWVSRAAEDDSRASWLRAKLALREGRVDEAKRLLTISADESRKRDEWEPGNPRLENYWSATAGDRRSAEQGRLLADLGVVALSRGDYREALDALLEGDYWADAAYVAERVLSADELRDYLRETAPEWSAETLRYWGGEEIETRWGGTLSFKGGVDPVSLRAADRHWDQHLSDREILRYLLARRLAREWRFDDAREWMPAPLLPLFDHYVALHRARRSGEYSGEVLANIAWRQARIHRRWGAELFGTEVAPDAGARGYSFEITDIGKLRADWMGQEVRAIPVVASEETKRVRAHSLPEDLQHRFHYRYVAADLAWKAGSELPRNDPQLAALYNTAGHWLAARDPEAADRFYQAMVRRCPATEEGRRADEKRWFLDDLPALEDLGPLPEELRPSEG